MLGERWGGVELPVLWVWWIQVLFVYEFETVDKPEIWTPWYIGRNSQIHGPQLPELARTYFLHLWVSEMKRKRAKKILLGLQSLTCPKSIIAIFGFGDHFCNPSSASNIFAKFATRFPWDSFHGGDADEGERFLSAFYMTVRCRWPSGERHRTVMQMLRSCGLP